MARKAWFARYPQGHLPFELRYPKRATRKHEYDRQGRPIPDLVDQARANPRSINRVSYGGAKAPDLTSAIRLYQGFTGKAPRTLKKIGIPSLPRAGLTIGKIFGIMYTVDATGERFHHEFKGKARPHLVVSSDGRQVFLSGGSYTFTQRGFVDRN
jgi:hypothetical protein